MTRTRRRKQVHLVHCGMPNARARKRFGLLSRQYPDGHNCLDAGCEGVARTGKIRKRANRSKLRKITAEIRRQRVEVFQHEALLHRAGLDVPTALNLIAVRDKFAQGISATMSDDGDLAPNASLADQARFEATRRRRGYS